MFCISTVHDPKSWNLGALDMQLSSTVCRSAFNKSLLMYDALADGIVVAFRFLGWNVPHIFKHLLDNNCRFAAAGSHLTTLFDPSQVESWSAVQIGMP
jgi:hypothetical protein